MSLMDVSVSELRANLSEWVRRARDGEDVVITDHGTPVARLAALESTSLIERLTEQGVISRPTAPRLPVSEIPVAKPTPGPPVSDLIRRQRDDEDL
jgi:prevent-host-death family protein